MIDWDRIEELREEVGDEDFAEVVEMFFAEVEETLDGLPEASGDALANGLHFLKGASLNVGMSELSSLCQSFEHRLKSGEISTVDISVLRGTLTASQAELRELLDAT